MAPFFRPIYRTGLSLGLLGLFSLGSACTWMSSDAASSFAGSRVVSRKEAMGFLEIAVYENAQACPNLLKPGLLLIDSGFDYVLTRPFYRKDSVDLCFVALLMTPCPAAALSDTDAANLYRGVLKACNPVPFEL